MKKYILILCCLFTLNSFAQFTSVDMFNTPGDMGFSENGYYYKDVTGYFNQFIGTWQYQNGTTTYILKLEKRTFIENVVHLNKTYQYDELIGALRVIKNGVILYNDWSTLNQSFPKATNYHINSIVRAENFNDCYMCTYPKQRLYLSYDEPNNDNYAYENLGILMHTYVDNGVTKLRLNFRSDQLNPDAFVKTSDMQSMPNKTGLFLDFGTFDFVKIP